MDISKKDIIHHHASIVDAMEAGEKIVLAKEIEAELGRRNLYYLCRYILQYSDMRDFHKKLGKFYDDYRHYAQFHLHPRGHFKTTMLTIGGKAQLILRQPDITILLLANTVENAETILTSMRMHFIANDKFRSLYPNHVPHRRSEEGTNSKFTTPARTKPWIRQATVETAGIDRALVSRHFDHIHYDDIVDDKNTNTTELRLKNWQGYNNSLSLLDGKDPNGNPWFHMVGTRWHMDDTYSRLLALHREREIFKPLITSAYRKVPTKSGGTEMQYLFPERFTPEYLEGIRASQGNATFNCLYLNDPVPDEDAVLSPSFFKFYTDKEIQGKPMNTVMTVDPAPSNDKAKDPSVITVLSMDSHSNIYIRKIMRGWWLPEELVKNIVDMAQIYSIKSVGIESVAFSLWLCYYVEKERTDRRLYFDIKEIKRNSHKSKEERQRRIVPFHRNGKIYYHENEPEMAIVTKEHREFPKGRYDDYLDTLTDGIEMLNPAYEAGNQQLIYKRPRIVRNRRNKFQTGISTRTR
jgi:phage terminase large subunit-like protein